MKKYTTVSLFLLAALMCACDKMVHSYPEEEMSEDFTLEINVDRDAPQYYKEIIYDEDWDTTETELSGSADTYELTDGYLLRIIADIYEGSKWGGSPYSNFLQRRTLKVDADAEPSQGSFTLNLPAGDYHVLAWADYVPEDLPIDWHYQPDTLTSVQTDLDSYPSDMHLRSCAAGSEGFILGYELGEEGYPALEDDPSTPLTSRTIPVSLTRPNGRYMIYSNDVQDFLSNGGSLESIRIYVTYSQYVSYGYNVSSSAANNFISSYSFTRLMADSATDDDSSEASTASVTVTDTREEVLLVGDYIFTSTQDSEDIVVATFTIYDSQNNMVNIVEDLQIPLMRNRETVIRGPFLTRTLEGGSGFGIDDEFGGEYQLDL